MYDVKIDKINSSEVKILIYFLSLSSFTVTLHLYRLIKHVLHKGDSINMAVHIEGLCFCFAGGFLFKRGKKQHMHFESTCGFAMKLTLREEEGGEELRKCQTSLNTRWILAACNSLHACRRYLF